MGAYVITGASRGIGAATALALGRRGHDVVVNYNASETAAARIVAAVEEAGGRAIAVQGDMAREADIVRLFQEADTAFGTLNGLVNNAGTVGAACRLEAVTADMLRAVNALNVEGVFLCCREAVRRMSTARGGGGGAIVNLSSRAAPLGGAGEWIHYGASKGAIDTLTVGLAKEAAAEGIRVNAVRPGLIDTDIHDANPGRIERLIGGVPAQRIGTPDEVAETVAWLLTGAPDYVTGSFIEVSGGR